MGTVPNSVGVGVGDEGAFEDGDDDVAEGMLDNSISIGSSGDQAAFGFNDFESAIGSGTVGLGF